jgi:hypothetical protein
MERSSKRVFGGYELMLKFPMVKLLDYESRWEDLVLNTNPFAMIVMAHLKTKATTANPEEPNRSGCW